MSILCSTVHSNHGLVKDFQERYIPSENVTAGSKGHWVGKDTQMHLVEWERKDDSGNWSSSQLDGFSMYVCNTFRNVTSPSMENQNGKDGQDIFHMLSKWRTSIKDKLPQVRTLDVEKQKKTVIDLTLAKSFQNQIKKKINYKIFTKTYPTFYYYILVKFYSFFYIKSYNSQFKIFFLSLEKL